MTFVVSQSKINDWRRCRRMYFYKYVLGLIKKEQPIPFTEGTWVHNVLEAHYLGKDWRAVHIKEARAARKFSITRDQREFYAARAKGIMTVLKGYFLHYKDDPYTFFPDQIEEELQADLCKGIIFRGKLDMSLVVTSKGKAAVMDHKFTGNIPSYNHKFADVQGIMYPWLVKEVHGTKIEKMVWNYILKTTPTVPEITKAGKIHRGRLNTWPEFYMEAVKNAEGEKGPDREIVRKLQANKRRWFKRSEMTVRPEVEKQVVSEVASTAREMLRIGGKKKERNHTFLCENCQYKDLCETELKGLDSERIKKTRYTQERDSYHASKTDTGEKGTKKSRTGRRTTVRR